MRSLPKLSWLSTLVLLLIAVTSTNAAAAPAFLTAWGTRGQDPGQFNIPSQLAVDASGTVYVTDTYNNRVQGFSATGTFLIQFGLTSPLDFPRGIALGAGGTLYVGEDLCRCIQVYTPAGGLLAQWPNAISGWPLGSWFNPQGLTVDAQNRVYIADRGNHRLVVCSSDGAFLSTWGGLGSAAGYFNFPSAVAVAPNGIIYVLDMLNNRIQVFDGAGTQLSEWGTGGTGPGQFAHPQGIALGPDGAVYVADTNNNRIQQFSGDGAYLDQWGSAGTANGQFALPTGLALDAAGTVYVLDSRNNRVQVFSQGSTSASSRTWGHLKSLYR
jgi:DNA-binding beta-propeller fold protein YncE